MKWAQRVVYGAGNTVMSMAKVTREMLGHREREAAESEVCAASGQGRLPRGAPPREEVTQAVLPVGRHHQKPSLSHLSWEVRLGVCGFPSHLTGQEKVLKVIRAACPTA